jgi:hypothetical protein
VSSLCSLITFLITDLSARSKRRKRLRARDLYILSRRPTKSFSTINDARSARTSVGKTCTRLGTARLERVEEYVAVGWLSTHTEPQPPWPAGEENLEMSRRSTLQGNQADDVRTDKIQQGALCHELLFRLRRMISVRRCCRRS